MVAKVTGVTSSEGFVGLVVFVLFVIFSVIIACGRYRQFLSYVMHFYIVQYIVVVVGLLKITKIRPIASLLRLRNRSLHGIRQSV